MNNLAFHNDEALAATVRAQVVAHTEADEIIKGTYWQNGKGCFIGCIGHDSSPATVESLTGFPVILTRIAEGIFESLPNDYAKSFPSSVMLAPRIGADLSLVAWKFLHWCVTDALDKYADDETKARWAAAINVLATLAGGGTVTADAARAAADAAADAADAADAAYAAARIKQAAMLIKLLSEA